MAEEKTKEEIKADLESKKETRTNDQGKTEVRYPNDTLWQVEGDEK